MLLFRPSATLLTLIIGLVLLFQANSEGYSNLRNFFSASSYDLFSTLDGGDTASNATHPPTLAPTPAPTKYASLGLDSPHWIYSAPLSSSSPVFAGFILTPILYVALTARVFMVQNSADRDWKLEYRNLVIFLLWCFLNFFMLCARYHHAIKIFKEFDPFLTPNNHLVYVDNNQQNISSALTTDCDLDAVGELQSAHLISCGAGSSPYIITSSLLINQFALGFGMFMSLILQCVLPILVLLYYSKYFQPYDHLSSLRRLGRRSSSSLPSSTAEAPLTLLARKFAVTALLAMVEFLVCCQQFIALLPLTAVFPNNSLCLDMALPSSLTTRRAVCLFQIFNALFLYSSYLTAGGVSLTGAGVIFANKGIEGVKCLEWVVCVMVCLTGFVTCLAILLFILWFVCGVIVGSWIVFSTPLMNSPETQTSVVIYAMMCCCMFIPVVDGILLFILKTVLTLFGTESVVMAYEIELERGGGGDSLGRRSSTVVPVVAVDGLNYSVPMAMAFRVMRMGSRDGVVDVLNNMSSSEPVIASADVCIVQDPGIEPSEGDTDRRMDSANNDSLGSHRHRHRQQRSHDLRYVDNHTALVAVDMETDHVDSTITPATAAPRPSSADVIAIPISVAVAQRMRR